MPINGFRGWVREVSERLHASGVYSSCERINRNERLQAATIEVAEVLLPQKLPLPPYFILNCTLAGPAWAWVIAAAMASAASSGVGMVSMCISSFTICCTCFLSALP